METDKIPQEIPMTQAHLESEPIHKNLLNQKGSFLLILGVVVILVVLGAGGYLLIMNKNQSSDQYISQPTSSNETANWKTYTSPQASYSFKYPDYLRESTSDYEGIGGMVKVEDWSKSDESLSFLIHIYSVYIYKEGINSKLEFNAKIDSEGDILVADQKVKKKVGVEIVSDKGTLIQVGPIKNKGYNYVVVYSSGSKEAAPSDLNTFNQMLSTFNFMDQNYLTDEYTTQYEKMTGAGYMELQRVPSPDGQYVAIKGQVPDINVITIKGKDGKVIYENIVENNQDGIWSNMEKLGLKGRGQVGYSIKEWRNNTIFILQIFPANGDEFETEVDVTTGKIVDLSFTKIK